VVVAGWLLYQSDLCHHEVLSRYREGAKGPLHQAELPLICARGIAAIAGGSNWQRRAIPWWIPHSGCVWPGITAWPNRRVFSSSGGHLSRSEYISSAGIRRADRLVWNQCGTLNPLQEHISERLLPTWARGCRSAARTMAGDCSCSIPPSPRRRCASPPRPRCIRRCAISMRKG